MYIYFFNFVVVDFYKWTFTLTYAQNDLPPRGLFSVSRISLVTRGRLFIDVCAGLSLILEGNIFCLFVLMTHSTHLIYGNTASDSYLTTD